MLYLPFKKKEGLFLIKFDLKQQKGRERVMAVAMGSRGSPLLRPLNLFPPKPAVASGFIEGLQGSVEILDNH